MEYIYFIKGDSIIGKVCRDKFKLGIPKDRFDSYLASGYVQCDAEGKPLEKKSKKK